MSPAVKEPPAIAVGIGASAAQHAAAHEEHVAEPPPAGVSAVEAPVAACVGHGRPSVCGAIPIGIGICIIAQPKPETASTVRIGKASKSNKTMQRFIGAG